MCGWIVRGWNIFINVFLLFIFLLGLVRMVFSELFEIFFKVIVNGYYYCDSIMEIIFIDGIKLEVKDLCF